MMTTHNEDLFQLVRCPETGQPLQVCSRTDAEAAIHAQLVSLRVFDKASGSSAEPFGPTPNVLLREDRLRAYPIVDQIPILLAPEVLGPPNDRRSFDLSDPRYDEAYSEMAFYNQVATKQARQVEQLECYQLLKAVKELGSGAEGGRFLEPVEAWLDAIYDSAAQIDAYQHLAPLEGSRVMQLGGQGFHAVKFLLGGAREAWVVTPMLGEIKLARALAHAVGVEERLRCVVSIAEELALESKMFDAIYSGGCVHHMVTEVALPEIARVLRVGGRFAAADPWKTPLHDFGTKLFGKREAVHCRPLTPQRIAPLATAFDDARVVHHGTLSRHLLLALSKLGLKSSLRWAHRVGQVDDAICSLAPGARRLGSSVALLGTKGGTERAA